MPARQNAAMQIFVDRFARAASIAALAALAACAGAPPSSSPLPAPPPAAVVPAQPPAADGTRTARVAETGYADARRRAALASLNAARAAAGAGPLAHSPRLDRAATGHAAYLAANGFETTPSVHDERAGLPDFGGVDAFVRMRSAGYSFSYASEVIGEIGATSPAADCIGDLLDTIYHAALLLSQVSEVGFGFGSGASAGLCTVDLATPLRGGAAQLPPAGAIVAYPGAGQRVAGGSFRVDKESPRAAPGLLPGAEVGRPVLVGFRNQDWLRADPTRPVVTITRFELSAAAGTVVPAVILANAAVTGAGVIEDAALGSGFAVLVPTSPLPAGRYQVDLRATIAGGRSLALTSWSFDVQPQ